MTVVIPAHAGIQPFGATIDATAAQPPRHDWIPACAGMTNRLARG
jgi:hypothetical protein